MFYDGICPLFYFFSSTVGLKYTQFRIDCGYAAEVSHGKIQFFDLLTILTFSIFDRNPKIIFYHG